MGKRDVVIIGAGPAGIMAAITASERGRQVMLVDRNPQIGRKLLSTGNGRCNLTNAELSIDRFHGASPDFIAAVINQFDQNDTMEFFPQSRFASETGGQRPDFSSNQPGFQRD